MSFFYTLLFHSLEFNIVCNSYGVSTLATTCQLTLSIDMSRGQSRRRVDMSRTIFFYRLTCQADQHSVGFQERMSIDRLQCGRMSVDIDRVELDKH